jgi:hypothetical protein
MPIVTRDDHNRPKLTYTFILSRMSEKELKDYRHYLRACLTKLPDSPVIQESLEAVVRELRWRAENPIF